MELNAGTFYSKERNYMSAKLYRRSKQFIALLLCLYTPFIFCDALYLEGIPLDGGENAIPTFQNTDINLNGYLVHVWEGFGIDASFYSVEWSDVFDHQQLHPSKTIGSVEKSNSLVAQRLSPKRADNKVTVHVV